MTSAVRARPDTDPWWCRLGTESPGVAQGCWEDPCDVSNMQPVDVYCHDHERFLPLTSQASRRMGPIVANVLRIALAGAFLLTALMASRVPAHLAVAGIGAALVGLPLRRYSVGWRAVIVAWVVVSGTALALGYAGPAADRSAALAAVAATAALWLAHFAYLALRDSEAGRWSASVAVSGAVAQATVAVYLVVVLAPASWLPDLRAQRTWILVVAAGALAGALFVAALGGVVRGFGRVSHDVRPLVTVPRPPRALRWAAPVAEWRSGARSPIERVARAVQRFLTRLVAAAVVTARHATNLLRGAAHGAAVVAVGLANWLHRRLVMCCRRVVAAALAAGELMRQGARQAGAIGRRSVRVVALPAAGLVTAGALAVRLAEAIRRYLVDGALVALAEIAAYGLAGTAALAVVWLALCNLELDESLRSLGRSSSIAGANALLVLAVGGWVLGLPGTLGYGPIKVGWITLTSTTMLVVALGWTLVTRSRRAHDGGVAAARRPPAGGLGDTHAPA